MSTLKTETKNQFLYVTLNRPEVHNAMDEQVIADMTQAFKMAAKNKTIRGAVLSGEGPSFCAGGDLKWMKNSINYTMTENLKDAQKLSDMYEAIFNFPGPVIALVHGNVMAGGVGLTAVCDIVAAEIETRFCITEVKLGLVPSVISPYVLRKVPETFAKPLMLTAEVFRAPHAAQIGLVHFVGSKEDCAKFVDEKVKMILNSGPEAISKTKELIHKVKNSAWPAARKITVKTIAQKRISKEAQEGMNAFFEKRKPSWMSEV